MRKPQSNIRVDKDVHDLLLRLKKSEGHRNISEVIKKYLMA